MVLFGSGFLSNLAEAILSTTCVGSMKPTQEAEAYTRILRKTPTQEAYARSLRKKHPTLKKGNRKQGAASFGLIYNYALFS